MKNTRSIHFCESYNDESYNDKIFTDFHVCKKYLKITFKIHLKINLMDYLLHSNCFFIISSNLEKYSSIILISYCLIF